MPPQNFYALCRAENGLKALRLSVSTGLQDELVGLFRNQELVFSEGVVETIDFDGGWKPEPNEMLQIDNPPEMQILREAIASSLAVPILNTENFLDEDIVAIFTGTAQKILIQKFAPQQLLNKRFTVILQGNTFNELTEPAFTLDTKLLAISQGGKLKFKSFHNLRSVFDLFEFYKEATEEEIEEFADHDSIQIGDIAVFKEIADQPIRKLIYNIQKAETLEAYTPTQIKKAARKLEITVSLDGEKIVIPEDKAEIKVLLRFLDDGIFEAALSKKRYQTNSKRPF